MGRRNDRECERVRKCEREARGGIRSRYLPVEAGEGNRKIRDRQGMHKHTDFSS